MFRDEDLAYALRLGNGYFLTGPQALTAREQVATIAEVTGRPIEFPGQGPRSKILAARTGFDRARRHARQCHCGHVTPRSRRPQRPT